MLVRSTPLVIRKLVTSVYELVELFMKYLEVLLRNATRDMMN